MSGRSTFAVSVVGWPLFQDVTGIGAVVSGSMDQPATCSPPGARTSTSTPPIGFVPGMGTAGLVEVTVHLNVSVAFAMPSLTVTETA
jgi:hypothetical protein